MILYYNSLYINIFKKIMYENCSDKCRVEIKKANYLIYLKHQRN